MTDSILFHFVVLLVGTTLLSGVYEMFAGNESFSLPISNILVFTAIGTVLSIWWGWVSSGLTLGLVALYSVVTGIVDRGPLPSVDTDAAEGEPRRATEPVGRPGQARGVRMAVPTRLEVETSPGVIYVGDAFGDPDAMPVFLLHGGGQTRHAWGRTAATLAATGFYAVAWDLRGHGDTSWAPDGDYQLESFAADLCALAASVDRTPAVVGASLGGLTSLLAHQRAPGLLAAVVLVDAAPKMSPDGVLRIVRFMMARSEAGFASLEEAADAIAEYLPHRPRPKNLSGLQKNLRLRDDGRYRWHWDPRFINRPDGSDPGMGYERLAAATRTLDIPTLLVRGQLSDVLSPEAAADFLELAPHSDSVDVADAAHMIAGDENDVFSGAVVEFLHRSFPG